MDMHVIFLYPAVTGKGVFLMCVLHVVSWFISNLGSTGIPLLPRIFEMHVRVCNLVCYMYSCMVVCLELVLSVLYSVSVVAADVSMEQYSREHDLCLSKSWKPLTCFPKKHKDHLCKNML
jgi:hypothetical protein